VAFWAITIYFFFDYVRPQNIYPVIDVIPWGLLALLIALFSALSDRTIKWVRCVENNILIYFYIIVILSGILAFKPLVSWEAKTEIINWILVYFLTINIINTEKRFFIFLLGYMFFSFKMSQHGFITWASRGFSFTQWGLVGAGGYFHNSGEYALQMLIFGSMSAAFVLALKEKWGRFKKWFFYLMPFTAFMTILGASSRGSQLALLVIGLLVMVRVKAGFKIFVTMVVLMALAYFLLPEEQLARFSDMGDDKNSITRFAYWSYGWEVIKDNPMLGVGYNNWLSYAHFDMPGGIVWGRIQLPHNIYIEVAAESGLLGLFSFMFLVIYAFVINSRTRKMALRLKHKFYYFMTYGFSMGLIGYLVAGTFVTVFYYPFFWVQIALIVALHNITKIKFEQINSKIDPNRSIKNR
ncbi:MAG: O-antigen ligase family protein, partial [Thiotrichaceae bacterium]|nr:O-antigen ligase family protein [Thiotrichaceae bacterium]